MRTVAANVEQLIGWNRSMAVTLERAENGSQAEGSYFIEELRKSAAVLGYSLTHCKEPVITPTEEELVKTEKVCRGCGNPKAIGLIVCWNCFKYRTDTTPLKYYEGTFIAWLETTKQVKTQ